ncbi:MAG: caspase family protein [Rhizobiaceae bacterium]|nr:caspase family protein [Rhizobiaceae bacterium]
MKIPGSVSTALFAFSLITMVLWGKHVLADDVIEQSHCAQFAPHVDGIPPRLMINADGREQSRVAFVAGIGAYLHVSELPNPVNDAIAMTETLRLLGFTVLRSLDATQHEFEACRDKWSEMLDDVDIALLHFSGHGIQIDDENFLLTKDAGSNAHEAQGVVALAPLVALSQAESLATIVLLDACRTNPYGDNVAQGLSPETGRGAVPFVNNKPLQEVSTTHPRGVLIAYSASPNAVAFDGEGSMSPFSRALQESLRTPGLPIQQVLSEVTRSVEEETGFSQRPWVRSSFSHMLKLNGDLTTSEAVAASELLAAKARDRLNVGDRASAIFSAVMAIPDVPAKRLGDQFRIAERALGEALRSSNVRIKAKPGVSGVSISPRGDRVITVQAPGNGTLLAELWDTTTGDRVGTLSSMQGESAYRLQGGLVFSADGSKIASIGNNNTVSVWDANDAGLIWEFGGAVRLREGDLSPENRNASVALNRDGSLLATIGGEVDIASIWNTKTKELIDRLTLQDVHEAFTTSEIASEYYEKFSMLDEIDALTGESPQVSFIDDEHIGFVKHCYCNKFGGIGAIYNIDTEHVGSKFFTPLGGGIGEAAQFSVSQNAASLNIYDNNNDRAVFYLYNLETGREIANIVNPQFAPHRFDPTGETVALALSGGWRFLSARDAMAVPVPEGIMTEVPTNGAVYDFDENLLGFDSFDSGTDIWKYVPGGDALIEAAVNQLTPEMQTQLETGRLRYWPPVP